VDGGVPLARTRVCSRPKHIFVILLFFVLFFLVGNIFLVGLFLVLFVPMLMIINRLADFSQLFPCSSRIMFPSAII
jgi:hypothetical protein